MDLTSSFVLLLCLTWACFHFLNSNSRRRRSAKLPPGPYPFPIIGNILQLGHKPHQSLTKLSKTYGPLMHLKLGSIDTIVVSSPEIAQEILQKHDYAFPGRMTTAATQALGHHRTSVACLPVGSQWRVLRKICREQMFSTRRLDASRGLRQEKLQKLLDYVQERCVNGRVIDIGEAAFVTSLNLISNTLFSVDFAEYNTGSSQELKEIVHGLMRVLGSPNLADYFPILGLFDPQGIKREAEFYIGKLLAIFDRIIDERVESSQDSPRKNDLLEALLEISQGNQSELSRNDMKHLLLDLFVAGTDTTSGTVEWVMTELLRNPKIMSKAKMEIRTVIGENKQVEELDISNLPYLQALIKETFRYHPPGPFLARRKDEHDMEINNCIIPKNAVILINIWTTGRDSRIWPNPDSFEPERFLNGEIDVKGHNFELIPFGAGRRICPGLPLAYRMVHLMVASLIHNFDWKLEPGMRPQEVDMNEKFGLSLQKAVPLKAVPIKLCPLQLLNE
ncbi:hypothetical protein Pfo_021994 [Paulownia fortunei]|nr:hypothetical protein Pfo_021994 [Paulownia fortunei]